MSYADDHTEYNVSIQVSFDLKFDKEMKHAEVEKIGKEIIENAMNSDARIDWHEINHDLYWVEPI